MMNSRTLTLLVVLALAGIGQAKASSFNVTLEEVNGNVVATGSGDIDLTDLSNGADISDSGFLWPSSGDVFVGPSAYDPDEYFSGIIAGPRNFGTGGLAIAETGSGDIVGSIANELIAVPLGYVSDSPLSDSATWSSATLSSLGVTPGTYTWSWGSGVDAGTFTLYAVTVPVPEPSQYGFGISLALAGLVAWRRFKTA